MDPENNFPIDTRTKAQKIGDAPSRANTKTKALVLTGGGTPKTRLSTASTAKRNSARDLALDYAESAILAAVDMMKTAQSEQSKIAAIRLLVEYGLGKPTVVHTDQDGNTLMPNLIIISGDTAVQTITTEYAITENEAITDGS